MRKFLKNAFMIGALISALALSVISPAAAEQQDVSIQSTYACARVHMQNDGWTTVACASIAGTYVEIGRPGQGLRVESLDLSFGEATFCLQGHVQNIGLQAEQCAGAGAWATVGTTGQGLRLERVFFRVATGRLCLNAYVADIGWQGNQCSGNSAQVSVGTQGVSKRIEALRISV